MKRLIQKFTYQDILVFAVFALSIFFMFNTLVLNLDEMNMWDESQYLNFGRTTARGKLTEFAWNPAVSFLYAIIFFPFSQSPLWMEQVATVGRFVLYSLIWWGGYTLFKEVAKEIDQEKSPLPIVGILFLIPAIIEVLRNPTDSLFAALNAFALVNFLRYQRTQEMKYIWWVSALLGLSALTRNDGILLFVIFCVLFILVLIRKKIKFTWQMPVAILVPFLAFLYGYLLIYGLNTGEFRFGSAGRTYVAFEQGQTASYQNFLDCNKAPIDCAVEEARYLYGEPEDNDRSVFKAISRNPEAFQRRLFSTIRQLPAMLNKAYGKRTAFWLLFFMLLAVYDLIKRKRYFLLFNILAWMAYLAVYFLLFFRVGYLRLPLGVLYALAGWGLYVFADLMRNSKTITYLIGGFVLLAIFGWATDIQAVYYFACLMLLVSFASFAIEKVIDQKQVLPILTISLVLVSGLMLHGSFEFPVSQSFGDTPEEQASLVMFDSFPKETKVAGGAPGGVWAAHMQYVGVSGPEWAGLTPEETYDKFVKLGVEGIYVDHHLSNIHDHVWVNIEPLIGEKYDTLYLGKEGSIRVLEILP